MKTLLAKRESTVSDFAKYVGVSRCTANRWVNGTSNPHITNWKRISAYLRITIEELVILINLNK